MAKKQSSYEWIGLISQGFRALRKEKGYSNYETFALDHDLDRKQYWRVENGSNLTIKTVIRMLEIHGIEPPEFFNEIKKKRLSPVPATPKKIAKKAK